jgi:hypothetical protein
MSNCQKEGEELLSGKRTDKPAGKRSSERDDWEEEKKDKEGAGTKRTFMT